MKTFDEILPEIKRALRSSAVDINKINKIIINRDLYGKIRFVADETVSEEHKKVLYHLIQNISNNLGNERVPHAINNILYESSIDSIMKNSSYFSLSEFPNVFIVDRMLNESNWSKFTPKKTSTNRIVFYSIKGGVGRSTALATTAWSLAEEGKKILVLDMDMESPGITSSLLSAEKAPMFGIVDWLLEDLLDNGDTVKENIISLCDLSRNGEIFVVPSHGKNPGEYISKINRIWMPKISSTYEHEFWFTRIERLISQLENIYKPDVVLIDSRAGIDEISSACITSLGAETILLFSIDSDQTWTGYNILFDHWLKNDMIKVIRDRLQIVGALIPDHNMREEYINGLIESSWDLLTNKMYDRIQSDNHDTNLYTYDIHDMEAPHYPRMVRWNRGFEALANMHQHKLIKSNVDDIFGDLIDYIRGILSYE